MILIVGLGNPGKAYAATPHNVGFRALDYFKARFLPSHRWTRGKIAMYVKGRVEGKQVILIKPRQYMNSSGLATRGFMKMAGIPLTSLWVVHDELDLPWGEIKIDFDRSSAGHKGVKSIIDHVGGKAFWRFRVGVTPMVSWGNTDEYLISFNTKKHMSALDEVVVQKVAELIFSSLSGGIEKKKIVLNVSSPVA